MVHVPTIDAGSRRRRRFPAATLGLSIAFLAVVSPNCVAATDPAQAWALAAEQGNAAALAHLYAAIDAHDRSAENWYGMYCLDRGNDAGAERWFGAAAQHGDAAAQYNLANLYANGLVSPHGAAQAVYWYRKAAEQGYAPAERSLGEHYLDGDGVKRDAARGQRWLQRAAAAADRVAGQAPAAAAVTPATPPATPPAASAAVAAKASAAAPAPAGHGSSAVARQAGAPGSAAASAAPAAAASPDAVAAAVRAWAAAWSSKNLPGYFGAYLPAYAPPGMSHAAWLAERRSRIGDKASIDVSLAQLRTRVDGNSATASFVEHFRAGALRFVGLKTLQLRLLDGRWLIASES